MTTLADLQPHDQFVFACQVNTADQLNGLTLTLYGPGRVVAAAATIAADGTMTGQLAAPANTVPVMLVTGFTPIAVGDVLQNQDTGEALVARWAQVTPDGASQWSPSATHQVIYRATGWSVAGHVDLQ